MQKFTVWRRLPCEDQNIAILTLDQNKIEVEPTYDSSDHFFHLVSTGIETPSGTVTVDDGMAFILELRRRLEGSHTHVDDGVHPR